ncbi:MAG TPA: OmpA family protein, partial [Longimicrobiaceae bacterium]|nr:OmpA family protein [Longimicrobiaceae bacterium]
RHVVILALASLTLVGCKKRRPADGPVNDPSATDSIAAQARADSMAREERLRRQREQARADSLAVVERERSRVREALSEMIFFEYDSYDLNEEAQERLRGKAELLRAHPSVTLRIEGHADQRGSTEYNLALGQRRAEAVRIFLEGYGIDGSRFATLSYGKERPLVEGDDEGAYARNRRAEFVVTGGEVAPRGR